jgi:hypothetical protein
MFKYKHIKLKNKGGVAYQQNGIQDGVVFNSILMVATMQSHFDGHFGSTMKLFR